MAHSLVTGGAGFIGSHLAEALLERGDRVRVLDNFSTGRRENLLGCAHALDIIEGDVRDIEAVRAALKGVDCVFHLAALSAVARSVESPLLTSEVNLHGTLKVLCAARDSGARRVVFASSSSVYGDSPELPRQETQTPHPLSPYAIQKLSCEHYLRVFWQQFGLETVALRFFNVYGPRQNPHSPYAAAIAAFADALLRGKRPTIFGDGRQSRDFTYVSNVVHALVLASQTQAATGLVINVGVGRRTDLLDLLTHLRRLTGCELEPIFEAARPADARHTLACLQRAREVLGYEVIVALEEGLQRTVDALATTL